MKPSNTPINVPIPANPLSSARELTSIINDIEESLKVSHDLVDTMFSTFGHMLNDSTPAAVPCTDCPIPVASPCGGRLAENLERLRELNNKLAEFTSRHDK